MESDSRRGQVVEASLFFWIVVLLHLEQISRSLLLYQADMYVYSIFLANDLLFVFGVRTNTHFLSL